jgi:Flp pilus assembly protein CpaB
MFKSSLASAGETDQAGRTMTDVRSKEADAPGAADTGRVIRRRRPLPGGRAVVGAFLVTVAAVGIFVAYADATGTSYVVAARDVGIGARLTAADFALVPLDLPPEQRARAFDDVSVLEGATLLGPLSQGDLLQSSLVVAAEPDVEQISFSISADRAVGGRLLPGERIDLLVTYGSGESAYTEAVVRDALVVKVDEDDSAGLGGIGTNVLSVAVPDPLSSLRIAHAVNAGAVTVVRTTGVVREGELPADYRSGDGS